MSPNTKETSMEYKLKSTLLAIAVLGTTPAWAQMAHDMHSQDGGHANRPAATTTSEPAAQTPGSGMTHDMQGTDDAMASMDHGSMTDAQGGTAPADARDPHAYSGGVTLDSGPYALPGGRQLRLADEHHFLSLQFNRLERAGNQAGTHLAYDAQLRYGSDYDRLVIRAEGEQGEGNAAPETRTELMWSHAYGPFWDVQAGLRSDTSAEPMQHWFALGVQGLAPYWFEIDAFAYFGEGGRTALRLGAEYELLLTQKWVLQPRAELSAYGQADEMRGLGSGVSDASAGLRLRYEISPQFAPYVGVEWAGKLGATADLARAAGEPTEENRWIAGVRAWF